MHSSLELSKMFQKDDKKRLIPENIYIFKQVSKR